MDAFSERADGYRKVKTSTIVMALGRAILVGVVLFFVVSKASKYLVLTPQSYGPYFWPRINWLLPHIVAGSLALLIGPLQFWSRIRRDHRQVHRWSGRVYLMAVLVAGVAALVLASRSNGSLAYVGGLGSLGVAWLVTAAMALIAVRNRNFTEHRQWMIRSYVVTTAFITFRLLSDLLSAYDIGSRSERAALLGWACWAIPLLLTEVALHLKAVFTRR